MARDIDFSKPLNERDQAYINQRPWIKTQIEIETGMSYDEIVKNGVPQDEEDVETVTIESYDELKKSDLVRIAKEIGIDSSGTKEELVARLNAFDEENEENES